MDDCFGIRRFFLATDRRRDFDVRGVVALITNHQVIFAGVGEELEFVSFASANGARIGLHDSEVHAETIEDRFVAVVHRVVIDQRGFFVDVEAVRVFHDELAAPHQTEARTDFVAVLRLDLVEVDR